MSDLDGGPLDEDRTGLKRWAIGFAILYVAAIAGLVALDVTLKKRRARKQEEAERQEREKKETSS